MMVEGYGGRVVVEVLNIDDDVGRDEVMRH